MQKLTLIPVAVHTAPVHQVLGGVAGAARLDEALDLLHILVDVPGAVGEAGKLPLLAVRVGRLAPHEGGVGSDPQALGGLAPAAVA